MNKAQVYKEYGIEYKNGKIIAPELGAIPALLIDGNAKLGKGVWTFSTLPGTDKYKLDMNGTSLDIKGTCVCDCVGCYAKSGFFRMNSTIKALAIRTYLARNYTEWVKRAIIAQIKAESAKLVRIHASGDFFSAEYVQAWREIAKECESTVFWTYTKNSAAESAFDDIANINIVKSVIPHMGLNYGHCDYILACYEYLKSAGKNVYICRCGMDKNQHCVNCKGCSKNEFVLFIEHSTSYKAESDPLFPALCALIDSQSAQ